MRKGYMGKVLWVDLTAQSLAEEEIEDKVYERFLSGVGLGAWILNREIPAGADPLGPDNVLGLASGLLTGTGAAMSGRWMAMGKSPLTGGWGDANGGGRFSPSIKKCGYDAIFFKGAAESPVYLSIGEGKAELKDASHLWGLDTVETEKRIMDDSGGRTRVACIGPAGERLSLISGIVTDGARIAARSGLGAVMGSKNLKAVALSGKERIETHDPERIKGLSREFARWAVAGDKAGKMVPNFLNRLIARFMRLSPLGFGAEAEMTRTFLRKYGTIVSNVISAEMGDTPLKNWMGSSTADYPLSTHSRNLDPGLVIGLQKSRYNCVSCPIGCGGVLDLRERSGIDLTETHKPEYETMGAFGGLILNRDLDSIFLINDMLNRAGMDTISAGSAAAFAMECRERGVLTLDDLDGVDLKWGDSKAVVKLVEKMIRREGIGEVLADGSAMAARRIGAGAEWAMHAGGQDLPMHDSRLDPGLGVAYYMEPTPGRHTNYSYLFLELFQLHKTFKSLPPVDMVYRKSSRYVTKDREILLAAASKFMQVVNGCGVCLFAAEFGDAYPLIEYINAAAGWDRQPEEYLDIGHRIQHARQIFNVRHGKIPARDFRPPDRALGRPPLRSGPLKGASVPLQELSENFTREMGWDKDGSPLITSLMRLGLSEYAETIREGS